MHPRFQTAFTALDPVLQTALQPIITLPTFNALLTPQQLESIQQTSGLDSSALALALLPLAATFALTPISHFNVGAIAHGYSGHWYFGANMEFTGINMQQTVHAEQSAITHAWLSGEKRLRAVTVNYAPCGHCRQFMYELNSGAGLMINLPNRMPAQLGDYLPGAFGPDDLAINQRLLDSINHHFPLQGEDTLTQAAIAAANASYAPYSKAFSGVALRSRSGNIYAGRYAENAAFNPSLPPLQAALIAMNARGETCDNIQQATLAEIPNASVRQHDATQATLAALGCHQFSLVALAPG